MPSIYDTKLLGEEPGETVQASDHPLRTHVDVGSLSGPLLLDAGDVVDAHTFTIPSTEANMTSMEGTFRWTTVTAIAPVARVTTGARAIAPLGVLASLAAMSMSSAGYVLAKRWNTKVDVLSSTSWQLIGGGLVLLPFAILAEGKPPALDGRALLGFAYVTII